MSLVLDDDKRDQLFKSFLEKETDLSYDWFHEYYQDEQSDRKNKKQDFTPNSVGKLLAKITKGNKSTLDIAAGTGGLTIQKWNENPDNIFYCEELSDRALPFLLFNLSIRNMTAFVFHGDSLTREYKKIYKLYDHKIEEQENPEDHFTSESVVMNPPFSIKWEQKNDDRFEGFGLAPKTKADYAFLLHGFYHLEDNGIMAIVLPHGVLFRGNAEGKIREKLLAIGAIDAVIGLPAKIFVNTDIPTTVIVLKKNRQTKDVLFIDASAGFEKTKNMNLLTDKHIDQIVEAYNKREEIEKFSHLAQFTEIEENDYNLNIPRFVDSFEEEEPIDLKALGKEIIVLNAETKKSESEFLSMLDELAVTDESKDLISITKNIFNGA